MDDRLHEKDLVISGRVFPRTQLLEVTRFLSIQDGVLHDLYYYCDTCYIRTVAPGKLRLLSGTGGAELRRPLNKLIPLIPSP